MANDPNSLPLSVNSPLSLQNWGYVLVCGLFHSYDLFWQLVLLADEMEMEPWDALANAFGRSHLCCDRESVLQRAPDRRERSLRERGRS